MTPERKPPVAAPSSSSPDSGSDVQQESVPVETNIGDILKLAATGDVPFVYANGLITFRTNADAGIVFQYAGNSVGVVGLSYTLTKTLVEKLGRLIQELEEKTDRVIMTTTFIDAALASSKDDDSDASSS